MEVENNNNNPLERQDSSSSEEEYESTEEQKALAERLGEKTFENSNPTCYYQLLERLDRTIWKWRSFEDEITDQKDLLNKKDQEIARLTGQIEVFKQVAKDNQSLVQGVIQTTGSTTAAAAAGPSFKRQTTSTPHTPGVCSHCAKAGKNSQWTCPEHSKPRK